MGDGTSRASKRRGFFKWKVGAGRRGTIRRAALRSGNGFEVMGACIALLDHARDQSHYRDNPEGVFKTTIEDLSIDYSTPLERVREVLGALVATGWLKVSPDVAVVLDEDDITVRVVRFLTYNDPQGSAADRKAAERERKAAADRESADLQGSVTRGHASHAKSLEGEGEERESESQSKNLEGDGVGTPPAPATIAAVPTPLPSELLAACEQAAAAGPRAEWWITSVQKLRQRDASAPDSVYIEAVDWVVAEANGEQLPTSRAWSMLSGGVRRGIARHQERVGSTIDDVAAMKAALSKPYGGVTKAERDAILASVPARFGGGAA